MTDIAASTSYHCDVCGISVSGFVVGEIGPVLCWRSDCPGKAASPRLYAVREDEDVAPPRERGQ